MGFYDYEYFTGANVIIRINNKAMLEAAAISYSYADSKQPIYGYSSRLFDAVAPGQQIVRGSVVINYVYDNYLVDCIRRGSLDIGSSVPSQGIDPNKSMDQLVNQYINEGREATASGYNYSIQGETGIAGLQRESLSDLDDLKELEEAIKDKKEKYWGNQEGITGPNNEQFAADAAGVNSGGGLYLNPLDLGGGVKIKIEFGNGGEYLIMDEVHFTGRGNAIQIDENVIVEEYSFISRRLRGSLTG